MKLRSALLASMAMLVVLVSSAMGCHYWCFGQGSDPATTTPDIIAMPNQLLTFTASDSAASYAWTVRDENNAIKATGTGSPFTWKVLEGCNKYYTVEWTATVAYSTTLSCIKSGCMKIKAVCINCPTFTDYCFGGPTTNVLKVTLPAGFTDPGYTYTWTMDGTAAGTGNPASYSEWNTLAVGSHTVGLTITQGTTTIKTCSGTFNVKPIPTGGVTWS